ncbi:alpha/beta fold hydrolase [Ramlibacter sp. PS4R-6]|uniref:alpha/beta fold hydrolase n=1 Tax=Ramlibacter sp. PS4R-6 TaxID=3133438 RepID=UPI0030B60F22
MDSLELDRIEGDAARSPIVFLHEGLGSVAMWRDWPRRVCEATGRAGFVYSRRGYGKSPPIPDVRGSGRLKPDYMHREALDVLPALLAELAIDSPVLLGHSDGGTIALIHAAHFPVRACIVMAPHVIVEDISVRSIDEARVAYETTDLRARLARYHDDVDGAFWQWNDIWLDPAFRDFDIRAECARIHAPVLAIQGEDDAYGTLRQIDEIAPAGGIARVVLADCGHSPHKDQPERTKERIVQFLRALG